jgi:protein-disulfide isomerase
MRFSAPLSALALALSLAACSGANNETAAPDAVDRMARAEVEAIVKDYLVNNPEVVAEIIESLGAHERNKTFDSLVSHGLDPELGPKDAPITIVEFFDYNCGYCKSANEWVLKQLDDRRNDVRVVFKEYPILRETSLEAAKAALAANKQGKYREMHSALMHAGDLSNENIEKIAKSVGLNIDRMKKDMESAEFQRHFENVYRESEAAGVEGTPGFFINGEFVNGFNEAALERILKEQREKL